MTLAYDFYKMGEYFTSTENIYKAKKSFVSAIEYFKKSLELRPDNCDVMNKYAWMLLTSKVIHKFYSIEDSVAYELSKKVHEIDSNNNSFNDTYACACAAVGDFDEAIRVQEKINETEDNDSYLCKQFRIDKFLKKDKSIILPCK